MLRVDPKDDVLMMRLNEAIKFAAQANLLDQLFKQFVYLGSYGMDRERPLMVTRCTLGKDFAPYAFRFIMEKGEIRSPTETHWEFWFNGGLLYQGPDVAADGSFPSLNVSLNDGCGWFVHT